MTTIKKDERKPTPEAMKANFKTFLANLTGEANRLFECPNPPKTDWIPWDMPEEKKFLEILWICQETDVPPTAENLKIGLTTKAMPSAYLDNLLTLRTDPPQILGLATFIDKWVQERIAIEKYRKAADIVELPMGELGERMAKANLELAGLEAYGDNSSRMTELERYQFGVAELRRRVALKAKGLSVGIALPFEKLRSVIPVLEDGQLLLWTGYSGNGKTMFATCHAEYNAWEEGHDVLYLHLETDEFSLQVRQWARYMFIPKEPLKNGDIDPTSDKWKPYFDSFENDLKQRLVDGKGQITYIRCPGWSTAQIRSAVVLARLVADARGKKLEVIVDYLQKIKRPYGDGIAEQIGKIANDLKDIAETTNTHLTVFSQVGPDGDDAYGSSVPRHSCQVHLHIEERGVAENDKPRTDGRGIAMKDLMGNVRYWHRKGDLYFLVEIAIKKDNEGGGGKCQVQAEGALGRVEEVPPGNY